MVTRRHRLNRNRSASGAELMRMCASISILSDRTLRLSANMRRGFTVPGPRITNRNCRLSSFDRSYPVSRDPYAQFMPVPVPHKVLIQQTMIRPSHLSNGSGMRTKRSPGRPRGIRKRYPRPRPGSPSGKSESFCVAPPVPVDSSSVVISRTLCLHAHHPHPLRVDHRCSSIGRTRRSRRELSDGGLSSRGR